MTSAVASSSNSFSMLSPKIMMFFLSFRGEDTRRNSTTSHLYEALLHKKIESYIDYQLEKGDEITLIQAIKDSAYLFSFSQRTMLPQSGAWVNSTRSWSARKYKDRLWYRCSTTYIHLMWGRRLGVMIKPLQNMWENQGATNGKLLSRKQPI